MLVAPPFNTVVHDHVLHFCATLSPECVNACVTSSPYFGVRSYPCEPLVWGGSERQCEHEWGAESVKHLRGNVGEKATCGGTLGPGRVKSINQGAYCQRCGAWRGQLGSEPLHDCLAWAKGEPPCASCFVCHQRTIAAAIWRVLRPDGCYLLNLGDSFAGNSSRSTLNNGFNERWGNSPGQKKQEVSRAGLHRSVAHGLKTKDLIGIPWRVALALQADGWTLRNDLIWAKGNPMPESVTDRHTRAHEYLFHLTKSSRYYWNAEAIREPHAEEARPQSERRRAMRLVRAVRVVPGGGQTSKGATGDSSATHIMRTNPEGRNPRSVLSVNLTPSSEDHYAAYPTDLIRPLIRAACPPGGVVLEPFCGSGTTPIVAVEEGRNYLACEWSAQYVELSQRRIARETGYLSLLLNAPPNGHNGDNGERSQPGEGDEEAAYPPRLRQAHLADV